MLVWFAIVGGSLAVGLVAARLLKGWRAAAWIAGAVAWLLMLAWLLVEEYVLPYRGGGASMWPIAQLFGGTVAAAVAALSCSRAQARGRGRPGVQTAAAGAEPDEAP
jgi:VanZ family protein